MNTYALKFLAIITAAVIFSFSVKTEAFAAVSPLVEITLNSNTKIYGLTAENDLEKKTGTLQEFADSVLTENVKSYVLFPANFFNAYEDTREVYGGIYSQGKLVSDSWFDYGCGFDADNNFYMFKLESLVSRQENEKIEINADGVTVEIVTAFNCYPWLIKDGTALEIVPTPAADENYLNRKAQRAFMGQKSDGTFVYGMLPNATMLEVRDACVELGLVNAVNTDGGASAGVYKDGEYLANPGRELASVVCIAEENIVR
jgi:exopolysaccharide biosynthesis protein